MHSIDIQSNMSIRPNKCQTMPSANSVGRRESSCEVGKKGAICGPGELECI